MVMRSLVRAVYRFRDATLVAEKKDDFGNALQNLYRELEQTEYPFSFLLEYVVRRYFRRVARLRRLFLCH
jgi:hypothetical protein